MRSSAVGPDRAVDRSSAPPPEAANLYACHEVMGATACGTSQTNGCHQGRSAFEGIVLQNSMVLWMKADREFFGWPPSCAPVRGVANLHRWHPPDATPTLSTRLGGEERRRGA
jgi:hypothetical protein